MGRRPLHITYPSFFQQLCHLVVEVPTFADAQVLLSGVAVEGIVRRIDDLDRVVIPKKIRCTMRICEGPTSQMTLARWERFCFAMLELGKRWGSRAIHR